MIHNSLLYIISTSQESTYLFMNLDCSAIIILFVLSTINLLSKYFMKEYCNFPHILAPEVLLRVRFLIQRMELMKRHQYRVHNQVMMMTLLKLSALGILYGKRIMSNFLKRWIPMKMMDNMEFLCMLKC